MWRRTAGEPRVCVAGAGRGTPVPVWQGASELTLPTGANATAGNQYAQFNSVTCTSAGNCVAVGDYADTNGSHDDQAMVATESNGTWGQASELTLPTGANTTAGHQYATLGSVTCTSAGNCVAVGNYTAATGSEYAMVATESNGTWGAASALTLPVNASTGFQYAQAFSVTCTSAGNCVAVGSYLDTNGSNDHQAMVATESSGTWGQASELTLPSGANTTAGHQGAFLFSVSCTSAGNCAAGGNYADSAGDEPAMVVTESSGTWGQASELSLPSGANTTAGNVGGVVNSVTCTSAGNCVAVGDYSVTCTSPGNCVAVGRYLDTTSSEQAMVVTSVASAPAFAPPPPGVSVATLGPPTSGTTSTGTPLTITTPTTAGLSATVTVPSNALPAGTVVSVYPVTVSAGLQALLAAGQSYLLSFAISWQAPDGSSPTATAPITMTVTDPSIVAGETIYALTSTGLVAVGHATQNGTATITFTTDPLFVVATLTAKHVSVKDHSSVTILGDDQQARAGAKITYRLTKHGKVLHKVAWKLARSHRFQWTTADLTRGNYVATFKIAGKTIKTTTITVG